jgi:restriction endonuclease S subunit
MTQKIDLSKEEKTHKQDEIQQHIASRKDIMASVEVFKSAVIRIRDILRGPGMSITGMDSMRHICLYLLSRYMTRDKVVSLDVPMEFAWETILEDARTKNGGVQFAIDCFFHTEGDCLVNHFDRLFGTEKFSFDVKNSLKHKEILEILDKVNMKEVDCEMDILGWVYEQHLKTGSSSASRDLGQFFTDRSVCEYMTELCKPGHKNGVPESVCDPSMGTGGFLTAYVKFFKKHYAGTPIDWSVQQQEIHGYDTDPRVAGVARLNLFMETGGCRSTNLLTHDSLYGDVQQTGFDIILANMPFGLKGLKHAECCERVRNLNIPGTKSEPLFLQLMMVSLNQGGRCAVVVPDGMLVNSSTCHNGTRKYFLDHFELKRIIKLEGKFFMNTGIKPSIIYFENTGKPTTAVEFWEVVKDDKGVITETLVVSVPREKIDAKTYALDMRRYIETEKPMANPARFPVVKLGEICDYANGKTLKSSEKEDSGQYDVMGGGVNYVGKTNNYNRDGETVSVSKSGASAGFVAYHTKKYWAGDCLTLTPKNDTTLLKYVYYFLRLNNHLTMSRTSGSTIPHCKWDDIQCIQMPLPPLPIQQEIVATLDRIYAPGTTELTDTLKLTDRAMELVLANPGGATLEPIVEAQRLIRTSAQMVADVKAQMVADVKAQMVAIMKSVGMRGYDMKELNEICNYSNGKTLKSSDKDESGCYDVMGGGMTYVGKTTMYNREGETISVSKSGASAGFVAYHNKRFWAGDCLTLKPKDEKMVIKYLYYYLHSNNELFTSRTSGSTIPHCKWDDIKNICIPIPSIEFQHSIVTRLDALQSQLDSLQALQKQSEDNARFILESYLGSV